MVNIEDKYAVAIRNEIRNKEADSIILKNNLRILGRLVGQKISEKYTMTEKTVETPTGITFRGSFINLDTVVVVSTFDDFECFGFGIAEIFPNVKRGYIDFGGKRGVDALTCSFRSITLPEVSDVNTVIIAKSVLATGCTAITLTQKALEKYLPKNLVVASVFYSERGYKDIQTKFKMSEIFTIGEPEELREDGILIPGFGDLDKRLCG